MRNGGREAVRRGRAAAQGFFGPYEVVKAGGAEPHLEFNSKKPGKERKESPKKERFPGNFPGKRESLPCFEREVSRLGADRSDASTYAFHMAIGDAVTVEDSAGKVGETPSSWDKATAETTANRTLGLRSGERDGEVAVMFRRLGHERFSVQVVSRTRKTPSGSSLA